VQLGIGECTCLDFVDHVTLLVAELSCRRFANK